MAEAYKAAAGVEEVPGSADLPLQHQNRRHSAQLEDDTFRTKSSEYQQAKFQDSVVRFHGNVEFSRIHNASGHKPEHHRCLPGLN